MATADNRRVDWTYVDDNGQNWAISAKSSMVLGADGAVLGGGASGASSDMYPMPSYLKPRKVKCVDTATSKIIRWVTCYESSATLYTTSGTSITLDVDGADVAFTSTKFKRGERYGRHVGKTTN